jgi:hypothetical protein
MPGGPHNSFVQGDLPGRNSVVVEPENILSWGDRARRETECFINGNISDVTKGWPVLSRMRLRVVVRRSDESKLLTLLPRICSPRGSVADSQECLRWDRG